MKRERKGFWGPTAFTSRGASVAEVLVSVVIVVISAVAASSYFTSQMSGSRNMRSRMACQAALASQMTYLRQISTNRGLEWSVPTTGTDMNGIVNNQSWFADSLVKTPIESQNVIPAGAGGVRVFNSHLLDQSSVGIVGLLLHSIPNICAANHGVDFSSIPHNGSSPTPVAVRPDTLTNFNAQIKVQPYDLVTGATDAACTLVWARPQAEMEYRATTQNPPIYQFPANSSAKVGYRVNLYGTYDSQNGPQSCTISDDFAFPVDRLSPKASVVLNVFDATVNTNSISPIDAMVPPRQRPQCTHTPGMPASLQLQIGFNAAPGVGKIEPGTIFLCRDVSEQVNPNYCPGATATGARMSGENYNSTNAPWVPCDQVTACGIPPSNTPIFTHSPQTSEQKYTLQYRSPGPGVTSTDGLWGCDIKIDVATIDPSGNFSLLSEKANPSNAAYSAMVGKYFQPTECWACYKKKSSLFGAIMAFVAITFAFGLIGAAIFCATGGGGICKPNHTKFLGNYCYDVYGPSGSKFCKKVPTRYPNWLGNVATPQAPCAAIPASPRTVYPQYPSMNYVFPATASGATAEDSSLDQSTGEYCEASAICQNGQWVGFPDDNGGTASITSCSKIYAGHTISIASTPVGSFAPTSGPATCNVMLPDTMLNHTFIATPSTYGSPLRVCSAGSNGVYPDHLCRHTNSSPHWHYPVNWRDGSSPNQNPADYVYFQHDVPPNLSLPECH